MYYVEIAQGSPRNRGVIVPVTDLVKYVGKEPLYRSTYLYFEDVIPVAQKEDTIRNYTGLRALDRVLIDIDKGDNSDEHTLNFARAVIFELKEKGLRSDAMQPYFSGSGYHIAVTNLAFNFEASKELPLHLKATMKKLLPDIDLAVYMRTGLYRVAHTINQKTNLYKIPLTVQEINTLKVKEIHDLAKESRIEFPYTELFAEGELEDEKDLNAKLTESFNKVAEPTQVVPCIQSLFREGPTTGSRHHTILRLTSHYRRHGFPSEIAKKGILAWNNNSMDEQKVVDVVESGYNGNYQYSCNDSILKSRCQTRCIYFQRKDYSIDVKSSLDMQEELDVRMTSDFAGRIIDLGKMFGLGDVDAEIYPGELVTIFGPTGSSKTTLAQNIALGVDFVNDKIVKEWQIPTLFLSLELSSWYMHRRHLQIVSNLTKDEVNEDYRGVYDENQDNLNHLVVQTVSPTLKQIQEKIRDLRPALLVVDYIDLIDTESVRGEYEKIKHISHGLSNMAVNNDLIIIQVSQVAREYSKNEALDLYAGKGSGAIENASRKVIGLNGQADSPKKALSMYKNTDGGLFSVDLEWRPSFRLSKV